MSSTRAARSPPPSRRGRRVVGVGVRGTARPRGLAAARRGRALVVLRLLALEPRESASSAAAPRRRAEQLRARRVAAAPTRSASRRRATGARAARAPRSRPRRTVNTASPSRAAERALAPPEPPDAPARSQHGRRRAAQAARALGLPPASPPSESDGSFAFAAPSAGAPPACALSVEWSCSMPSSSLSCVSSMRDIRVSTPSRRRASAIPPVSRARRRSLKQRPRWGPNDPGSETAAGVGLSTL